MLSAFRGGCAVEFYKRISKKRERTGRERARPERALPYWVAALIQQQTDPKTDHLSPLWSPYKSSTFPLFSSAAHKLIKLAFPCCFWQMEGREASSEVYCGWSKGCKNQCMQTHTRTAHCSASTGSTTKLLFLPEWYMGTVCLQLNKCCWGRTRLGCLHFPWALSSGSGVSGECWSTQSVSVRE